VERWFPILALICSLSKQLTKEKHMKLHFLGLSVLAATLILSTGCASNARLESELDACQAKNVKQSQDLAHLNLQVAMAKSETAGSSFVQAGSDALDAAGAAWNWSVNRVGAAYQATEQVAHRCYDESKGNVHSFDDARALAVRCWNGN
jgi:hypothetical protein